MARSRSGSDLVVSGAGMGVTDGVRGQRLALGGQSFRSLTRLGSLVLRDTTPTERGHDRQTVVSTAFMDSLESMSTRQPTHSLLLIRVSHAW